MSCSFCLGKASDSDLFCMALKSDRQAAQRQSKSVLLKNRVVSGRRVTVWHWQRTMSPTLHSKLVLHLGQCLVSCLFMVVFLSSFFFSFKKKQDTETAISSKRKTTSNASRHFSWMPDQSNGDVSGSIPKEFHSCTTARDLHPVP